MVHMDSLSKLNSFIEEFILPINLVIIIEENWKQNEDVDPLYGRILGFTDQYIAKSMRFSENDREKCKSIISDIIGRLVGKFYKQVQKLETHAGDIIQTNPDLARKILDYKKILLDMQDNKTVNVDILFKFRELEEIVYSI